MQDETKQVVMTAEEAAEFERFKADKAKKEAAEKKRKARGAYNELVDEAIESNIATLDRLSRVSTMALGRIIDSTQNLLQIKGEELNLIKDGQKSHTFTHSNGELRFVVGQYPTTTWRDTVEDGIAIVKEAATGFIDDAKTKALVNQILRLLARDKAGNLRPDKVKELRTLGEELNSDRLIEGVTIIEEAKIETLTKRYVVGYKKDGNGTWRHIPIGMTEA